LPEPQRKPVTALQTVVLRTCGSSQFFFSSLQEKDATFAAAIRLYRHGSNNMPQQGSSERGIMIAVRNFMQPEVREKMTVSILNTLSRLPETEKNIFIWKHYSGWPVERIASVLNCSTTEVDRTLRTVNALLSQQAETLLN
jgi:DNA-directed RNA polymerase specialized sigma24 family protein